jgi:hypothetical protein
MSSGDIPVLSVLSETIPHAYERAIREVWEKGDEHPHRSGPSGGPPTRDATVVIAVEDPFAQLRIHCPFESRTWTSEFVTPHFIHDGVGKGLRSMLEREHDMPPELRESIAHELEAMAGGTMTFDSIIGAGYTHAG